MRLKRGWLAQDENAITQGVIWKQLLLFFFPILLGTFFQQLYNTVDAMVVGRFVGKEALASVGGPAASIINLLVGFFVGLSSGATVIISQYYGGGREDMTQRAVHTAIALSLAGGAALMVIGMAIAPASLRLVDTPEEIMGYSLTYIRIYFGGIIFSLIYNIGSGILRAVGDAKRPLYCLIVCCLVNVALDLLFVVVFRWGVAGVAVATMLSQTVSAVLVWVTLTKTTRIYRLHPRRIRFDLPILRDIIRIGIPAGLQSVMYSLSNLVVQASINSFGTDTIAAWTAYGKIDGIFWMIMGAFGVSITTFAGQNFGAKKYDRLRQSVRVCTAMAMGTALFMGALVVLAGPYIYRLFTTDAAVVEIGMAMVRIISPFYFTYVLVEVLSGATRGAGDSLMPMLMTCLGACILRIVWVQVAVPLVHEVRTICLAYPITWTATSILFLIYYLKGGWLKRRIAKAEAAEASLEQTPQP